MSPDTSINVFINGWATCTRVTMSFAACITSRKDRQWEQHGSAAKQPVPDQALINLGHWGMGRKQTEKQGFVWLRDIKKTSQCYLFLTPFRIIKWNQTPSSFHPLCVPLLSVNRCSTSQSWGLLPEGAAFPQLRVWVALWCQPFCRCALTREQCRHLSL